MKYKIKVYSIWEFGKRKDAAGNPHQEDSTYPHPDELKDSDRTFILCDGMGGHDAGEVASATVCQAMGNYILNDGHDSEDVFTDDELKKAIEVAFEALDKKDNGAEKKMGTTMTFLKLHNDGATIAHMGDSRVYHIRPGKDGEETQILFETKDHSLVNDLIKTGDLTREEARMSKQKNVITRAMQPNMDRKPKADIKHITDIKAGDYFYMCSDGMLEEYDMENGKSLRNIFSEMVESTERKVEILRGVTKDNRDNHTALIIHIEEVMGNISQPLSKESVAVVSSKKMGIIEDDEVSEVQDSQGENTSTPNLKKEVNGDTNNEKSEIKSTSDENPIKEDTNCSVEKTAIKNAEIRKQKTSAIESKSNIHNTHKNITKIIIRTILVAILVTTIIIVINDIPSCSKIQSSDKVESPYKKENSDKGKTSKEKKTEPQIISQSESQSQEKTEEVTIEAANSETAQIDN